VIDKGFKSGFVVITGKPNVGKSSVLNWFFGEKIAIVSPKPETTRDNIRGILTTENAQAVFIDTPGIHKAHLKLGKEMVKRAKAALGDADLLLVVIDAASGIDEDDEKLFDSVKELGIPALALLNKVDAMKKGKLLPMIEDLSRNYHFLDIIPISALRGDNMDVVKEKVLKDLPEGEKYYPDGQATDRDIKFRVSEIIREKALILTRKEVPHSIAVLTEEMIPKEEKGIIYIKACIYTERPSQKAIIIGHGGSMIKEIGTLARKEIEDLLKKKVFLDLWVKVIKKWRSDPNAIKRFGLQ